MKTFEISSKGSSAARGTPVAELEHVCFDYGTERVLDHVNLVVRRGDFLGIIGPNGSGKTTLLRVMLGLLRPCCGHVRLFGQDIREFRDWHRIGYVPQKAVAFESRFPASVFEVVVSGRTGRVGLGRRFGPADYEAAERALETVGMAAHRDRLVGRLSGGEQQRVFIARALASEPDLLVLDEPTVGVDVEAQERFYGLLRHLNRDLGTTLVLVSHDIGVVAQEVTQLACLNRSLFFHGSPEEALRSGALEQLYRAQSLVVAHRH
ncbi:MAG: metal ABC transporter ATP-binding protein [Armatimonadota bacterium]|nr:metal ABC transporter ATP-binding protein [Armatimonadota bacterium]MDR5696327.1 metal ABC transporter ATP-binding protein [Armatimonadota bacterium]